MEAIGNTEYEKEVRNISVLVSIRKCSSEENQKLAYFLWKSAIKHGNSQEAEIVSHKFNLKPTQIDLNGDLIPLCLEHRGRYKDDIEKCLVSLAYLMDHGFPLKGRDLFWQMSCLTEIGSTKLIELILKAKPDKSCINIKNEHAVSPLDIIKRKNTEERANPSSDVKAHNLKILLNYCEQDN